MFLALTTRHDVKKLFKAVIYKCLQYARVFVSGKPDQPNLMIAGKARAYLSENPFRGSTEAAGLSHEH